MAKKGSVSEFFKEIQRLPQEVKIKEDKIRAYRNEASRLSALANKRIQRLEKNKLTDTPAYKTYLEGGGKFGVKGKTYNEVQAEVSRLNKFINSKTSTIRGATQTLKEIAENTGIKYKNLEELKNKSKTFFELSSKVEQYLRTVEDMASAIGYQKIWEAINTYVDLGEADIDSTDSNLERMIEVVTKALTEYEKPIEKLGQSGWFTIK